MDPAYISAVAALAGTAIGGLTSLATSWLTQHQQFRAQLRVSNLSRRETLYKNFIEEASRLYADAFAHDATEVSSLVNLYTLVSEMRIMSSSRIVESADRVIRVIIETYLAPNRPFRDVLELMNSDALNPLRDFSNACREELRGRGFS